MYVMYTLDKKFDGICFNLFLQNLTYPNIWLKFRYGGLWKSTAEYPLYIKKYLKRPICKTQNLHNFRYIRYPTLNSVPSKMLKDRKQLDNGQL